MRTSDTSCFHPLVNNREFDFDIIRGYPSENHIRWQKMNRVPSVPFLVDTQALLTGSIGGAVLDVWPQGGTPVESEWF